MAADAILIPEHGRAVERGRHQDLIARGGLYAKMWALQEQESELRVAEQRAALQPVNLASIIAAAIDALRAEIDARKANLYTMIDADAGRITGDPSALQQLVWQLLAHAIRTSPVGSRVEVRLSRDGAMSRLLVADTAPRTRPDNRARPGPGLAYPPTNGEAAFDPGALRRTVEGHGGRFNIDPADGAGTTCVATFPLRAVAAPGGLPPGSAASAPAVPSLAGRHVMIVDDQDDARDSLSQLLEHQGARVEALPSAAPALERLRRSAREQWPDALVCDIGLPDEDGYTVLRRVRALEAERGVPLPARLPAIALSGYAAPEDRMRALLAGFQMHLGKPVDAQELIASIASVIGTGVPARR